LLFYIVSLFIGHYYIRQMKPIICYTFFEISYKNLFKLYLLTVAILNFYSTSSLIDLVNLS